MRPPFGLTITPATYWGAVGVMGVLVPPRWCQNDAQQNRQTNRNPTCGPRQATDQGASLKKHTHTHTHKVGRSLCVELRFFGLFCKNLLHVILTPPGRYQHPHDTSNPPVGRWGNCEPKWWPQGSSFCLLKNNIANTQGKKR